MRKNKKIPTIIGVLVLVLSLAVGVIAVQSKLFLRLGATQQATPQNVRIADISTNSFSVSWTTENQFTGFVKYGEGQNSLSQTQPEQATAPGFTHLAKITNLKSQTPYYFKINSGGNEYDNNGIVWQTQTAPENASPKKTTLVSGSVLTAASAPAKDALVYVSFGENVFSSQTSQNGSFIIPVNANLDESTVLEISVQAGPDGIASAQVFPANANPIPTIVLGQTYDFKNLPSGQESVNPEAQITAPEETSSVSGFEIPAGTASPSSQIVTLDSIKDGETVNTTQPELLGNAPPATILTITVESELISEEITTPASGQWSWAVPNFLTPGNHKITITWKDAAGVTRTLIRNFVVSAAEGPAFEATPSATLTPTPSATPSRTLSPTPTSSSSATPIPQPVSGSLTPTIILSIMGVGLITFGFVFWKQSYA